MTNLKKFITLACVGIAAASLFAEDITLHWGGNSYTFTTGTQSGSNIVQVPNEILNIIKQNQSKIETALADNQVTAQDITDNAPKIKEVYDTKLTQPKSAGGYGFTTDAPITTATNGLNGFCNDLCDSLPNSQTQQNVWAEAWIGKLFPFPHLGFGINAGVSQMEIKSLKDAAQALSIDVKDLRDSYVLPTVTADFRLGGIVFPFDIGLNVMSVDTSKIGSLESSLDPVSFDFFTLGMDVRYALLQGGGIRPKVSVGGGFYYTDGSVNIKDDNADASLNFNSTTIFASAQASVKLICLVPFIGGRLLFSKTKVDWNVNAKWDRIFSDAADTNEFANVASWGIMPSKFSGSGESGFFEDIRPQLFGGVGLDVLILNITASLSYDVLEKIPGGALSVRLAL